MPTPLAHVHRDGNTADFLEGTARGVFLLRKCTACGTLRGPQEGQCNDCPSTETEWIPASGTAEVVSWTVVHGRFPDGTTGPQSIVAIGQLAEGPWWWTQVFDAEPTDMEIGRRLTIAFEPEDGGETLPVFRLA